MTAPTKANALQEQGAGQKNKSDYSTSNFTVTASRVKALIVGAACWGLLHVRLAEWIIRRLHLEAA